MCMYENLTLYSKSSARHTISANTVLAWYKKASLTRLSTVTANRHLMCLMYSICGHWPLRDMVVLFSTYWTNLEFLPQLVWMNSNKSTFHFDHIQKRAHSKKYILQKGHILFWSHCKWAHSKEGTSHFDHVPKQAHSNKNTSRFDHIPKNAYPALIIIHFDQSQKRPHSNNSPSRFDQTRKRAHSKKSIFQKG